MFFLDTFIEMDHAHVTCFFFYVLNYSADFHTHHMNYGRYKHGKPFTHI